jgi:hypothetical protein
VNAGLIWKIVFSKIPLKVQKMTEYKIKNGTYYHCATDDAVIKVLESARINRTRLHISYGYTDESLWDADAEKEIGLDWLEEFDTVGRIGRSTGDIKIPLICHNSRSIGGSSVLSDCIVRIRESKGKRILYEHPQYHVGTVECRIPTEPRVWNQVKKGVIIPHYHRVFVYRNGSEQAAFETMVKARRYLIKLGIMDYKILWPNGIEFNETNRHLLPENVSKLYK